jgi:hypothetical protein
MEKKENNTNQVFKLLGFAMEQANNVPKIVEKKGKKWIEFGEKDNYPDLYDKVITDKIGVRDAKNSIAKTSKVVMRHLP